MRKISTVADLRILRQSWRTNNETLAFVPTMGNLHEGHLKLVRYAKENAKRVVVSIFVNPMQFGKNEDLDTYPRTVDQDCAKLESLGVDAVFLPTVNEMYPRGLDAQTYVNVPNVSKILCGKSRTGHFQGVTTVVSKLFNMVEPNIAVFGKKDYQQLQLIKLMVLDLSMNIDIRGIETEREPSGLALSSRNGFLTKIERDTAASIFTALKNIAAELRLGNKSFAVLCDKHKENLIQLGFKPDYVEIRNADNLLDAQSADANLVILIAAYLGKTRLIDNLTVNL